VLSESGAGFTNVIGGVGGAVTLQGTTPGIADTGNLNLTGTGLFGKVGVGINTPGARIESRGSAADSYTLRLSTNASSYQVVATTTGLVGIGTSDPLAALDVRGSIQSIGNGASIAQKPESGDAFTLVQAFDGGMARLVMSDVSTPRRFDLFTGGNAYPQGPFGGKLAIADATANIVRLALDSDGRMGVGTVSPATQLEVNGDAQFGSGAAKSTFTTTGSLILDTNANLQVGTTFYVGAGRVGIGNSAPSTVLHVTGNPVLLDRAGGVQLNINDTLAGTDTQNITFQRGGTAVTTLFNNDLNQLTFQTTERAIRLKTSASDERMRVEESGEVGVGTSAPDARLHVSSASAAAADTLFAVSTHTAPGSEMFVIKGDGRVGIGAKSPDYPLHVVSETAQRASILIENKSPFDSAGGALLFSKNGTDRWALFSDASKDNIQDFSIYDSLNSKYRVYVSSFGGVAINDITYPLATLDLNATLTPSAIPTLNIRGMNTVPAVSGSGQASLYYDIATNKLKVSENGSAYASIIGAAPLGSVTLQPSTPGTSDIGHINVSGHIIAKEGLAVSSPTAAAADNVFTVSKDITAGNEVFTVKGDGKVGVGTTEPQLKFDVRGMIGAAGSDAITSDPPSTPGAFGWKLGLFGTSQALGVGGWTLAMKTLNWLSIFDGNPANDATGTAPDSNAKISFNSPNGTGLFSGNVGIGTTNPGSRLEIKDTTAHPIITVNADSSDYDPVLYLRKLGAGQPTLQYSTDLVLQDSGANKHMKIASGGNVGIGTTSPDGKLDIFGNGTPATNLVLSANYENSYRWRMKTVDRGTAIDLDATVSDASDNEATLLQMSHPVTGRPEFAVLTSSIVLNNSNVGMGTTDPVTRLQLQAPNTELGMGTDLDPTAYNRFGFTGGAVPYHSYWAQNATYNGTQWNHVTLAGYGGQAVKLGQYSGTFEVATSNSAGDPIVWSPRFNILNNGSVGVGTTGPVRKLNVSGSGSGDSTILVTDTSQGADLKNFAIDNRSQVFSVGTDNDAGSNFYSLMTVTRGGSVGVGTTNPAATLDVSGTGAIKLPVGTSAQRPATPATGMLRFNSSNSSVEFYNGAGWMTTVAVATPPVATGGTETSIVDKGVPYKIHTFTGSGSLNVTSPGYLEVLVVGGGGSGGNHNTTNANGGGGGGGVVYRESYYVSAGAKTVTVGAGGVAIAYATISRGNNGQNSVFDALTALGGGGGGSTGVSAPGYDGGSGGGGAYGPAPYAGGQAIQAGGYGNPGGRSYVAYTGGGGGGAGSAGVNTTIAPNGAPDGNGGRGMGFTISGSLVFYAGGGGGSGNSSERAGDGYDGGGRGAGSTTYYTHLQYPGGVTPTGGNSLLPGLPNTGGGGGGGSYWTSAANTPQCPNCGSGAGGSGIVIVRYRLLQ